MATLNQEQIKTLESTRQRLVQLTRSLGSLVASLNHSDPLPPWTSLQSQASIISNNLISVSEQLSEHQDLFASLVAYPGPEYPSRTQANTLEQLLRTKLDPRVEDWVNRGRISGTGTGSGSSTTTTTGVAATTAPTASSRLSESELAELWEWAPLEANQEARRRNWGGNFTLEEKEMGIQNVVTGLRRQLEDEDEDEEEDEEEDDENDGDEQVDEMETEAEGRLPPGRGGEGQRAGTAGMAATAPMHIVAPAIPLDEILRFMTTGQPPMAR